MFVAWSHRYCHPLPEGHRFPMIKYELLPQQLLHEGVIAEQNLFAPGMMEEEFVQLTHETDYLRRLREGLLDKNEVRRLGFPLTRALYERELEIVNGTYQCALLAMRDGVALNTAGGTHHAGRASGEGFCLLNDVAVAANLLLHEKKCDRIFVIDLDVHQGNGTAEIFAGDDRVFTLSIHGEKNFPMKKAVSDCDIGLPDGCNDELFLGLLNDYLPKLMDAFDPQLLFFNAGVDMLSTDKLGRLNVSRQALLERDRFVFENCRKRNLPVAVCMGGGYSPRIADIVDAHAQTFRTAREIYF